jgi:hypothetical protein
MNRLVELPYGISMDLKKHIRLENIEIISKFKTLKSNNSEFIYSKIIINKSRVNIICTYEDQLYLWIMYLGLPV